ncbi:uncharacterized protein Z518_07483 [Rhinocladiella mackenziei CBS 650.93]|uniref:Rhinocladiella mackenziei CBS 650.93 unplaced genomic scaffold supercont1.5, whole genome shotgun sequence n=1 Tax=Rhinocladiella mackenziei CBS 650.93 TaxID=1442369 RepID=A0A0D2J4J7_9EURO|nr:uncharacterized protein Z518_07483 [Rhinocladiella mackenziei CBS 650.93]KIX03930.1 hypothetical protein Z518_07483 [Rhinocladiella mackenziei CBS 650.93]
MAEPDEVEEDLFADLYDGDENARSNNAPAPVAAQPNSSDTAMKANDVPGYGEEPEIHYDPTSFDVEPSGQDEQANGTQSQKQDQDSSEKPSHPEPFGINMKEDG